jgi:MFS family permease
LRAKRKVDLLARIGHGANDMYFFTFPSVLPLILAQYGFSYTAAGGYLTAFLCTVGLFSFLFGKLADKFPRWVFLSGGFFVASLGLIVGGFMPRFWLFMVCLLVTAVGVSTYHPVAYAVIEEGTPQRRGQMFAMFEIFGAIGVLSLFLLHGTLLTSLGWKLVVIITSIPGIAVGVLFAVHRKAIDTGSKTRPKPISKETAASAPFLVFVVFFLSIVLRILCFAAVWNFMPTFLVDAMALESSIASFVTGFLFVGAILVNLFAGRLADRVGPIIVVIGASVLSGIFVLLATYATASWMLPIILVFMGAGVSSAIPAQNLILSLLSRRGRKGEAYGMMMGIITLANSMAPLLFGVLADSFGLKISLRLISIPVWLSCLLLLGMLRVPALKAAMVRKTAE